MTKAHVNGDSRSWVSGPTNTTWRQLLTGVTRRRETVNKRVRLLGLQGSRQGQRGLGSSHSSVMLEILGPGTLMNSLITSFRHFRPWSVLNDYELIVCKVWSIWIRPFCYPQQPVFSFKFFPRTQLISLTVCLRFFDNRLPYLLHFVRTILKP